MIKAIAHVCIGATDLQKTEKFYCQDLGLAKKFNFVKNGKIFGFYLAAGNGSFIEVFEQSAVDNGKEPLMKHICLEVDSVARTVKDLKAKGIPIKVDTTMGADNSWQAWTEDPSGVAIEFHEYTPTSCQFTGKDCIANW
jgi:catechol 2,3-dioxygenase-like lactoylglutathione lyase family enzyme